MRQAVGVAGGAATPTNVVPKVLAEVPGDQAFRPLKDGNCPYVKN